MNGFEKLVLFVFFPLACIGSVALAILIGEAINAVAKCVQ